MTGIKKIDNGIHQADLPPRFPFDKIQYLELFENKDKLKSICIGKDYVPEEGGTGVGDFGVGDFGVGDFGGGNSIWGDENVSDVEGESRSEHLEDRFEQMGNPMRELLDDGGSAYSRPHSSSNHNYNKTPEPLSKMLKHNGINIRGGYQDLNQEDHSTEDDEETKRLLLTKFKILKEKKRKVIEELELPEFSMHSDIHLMKKTYDSTLKHINIKQNVRSYKTYMGIFFVALENMGSKVGLDMEGYAKCQMNYANEYDELLIELGEKWYSDSDSKYAVETRLMLAMTKNTVLFLFGKMFQKNGMSAMSDMLNVNGGDGGGGSGGSGGSGGREQPQQNTPPMPGPPDMNEVDFEEL